MSRPARLLDLVQLLAGRRALPLREIADRFEISERTAYRDLAELSRRYIPVTRTEYGYRLLDTAVIRPLALNAAERAVLKLLLDNPAARKAPDVGKTLELVEAKLDLATRQIEETPSALTLAGPERSGKLEAGLTSRLGEAVAGRTPISIQYRSLAGGLQAWRGVDPYEVFHRENAWYLVGRCHLHDEPRTFRLDRISDCKPLGGTFRRPDFDVNAFLESTWAVYRGRTQHDIEIHFDAALAPLIEEGFHHPTEKVKKLGNGNLEYRVQLSHLDEIARWVVSFAGRARAIKPTALVTLVHDIATAALGAHRPEPPQSPGGRQEGLPGLPALDKPTTQRPLI